MTGVIDAPSRDAAFGKLREQGIRPFKVDLAPGVFNRLGLIGKRGWALVVLGAMFLVAVVAWAITKKEVKAINVQEEDRRQYEQRSQIYGDPAVLNEVEANGWSEILPNKGDRYLAQYAIPGKQMNASGFEDVDLEAEIDSCIKTNCPISDDDLTEIAKMKRMINGMKREARNYLQAGGSIASYLDRMNERQRQEIQILNRFRTELSNTQDENTYRERNLALRQMGLPMVPMPDEDSGL